MGGRLTALSVILVAVSLSLALTWNQVEFSVEIQGMITGFLLLIAYHSRTTLLPLLYLWWVPFFIVLLAGTLWAGVHQPYAVTVTWIALSLGIYSLAVSGCATTEKKRRALLGATAVASVIMASVIVSEAGIAETLDSISHQTFRLGWEVGQPNKAGQATAVAALIALEGARQAKRLWTRVLGGALVAALAAITIGTQSRRALLLLVVGILLFLVLVRSLKTTLVVGGSTVIFALVLLQAADTHRLESLLALVSEDKSALTGSDAVRAQLVEAGWKTFGESPLLGIGTGTLRFENQAELGSIVASHNNFVELLANNGLVGFIAFYLPLLVMLAILLREAWVTAQGASALVATLLATNIFVAGGAAITYLDHMSVVIFGISAAAAHEYLARRSGGLHTYRFAERPSDPVGVSHDRQ